MYKLILRLLKRYLFCCEIKARESYEEKKHITSENEPPERLSVPLYPTTFSEKWTSFYCNLADWGGKKEPRERRLAIINTTFLSPRLRRAWGEREQETGKRSANYKPVGGAPRSGPSYVFHSPPPSTRFAVMALWKERRRRKKKRAAQYSTLLSTLTRYYLGVKGKN